MTLLNRAVTAVMMASLISGTLILSGCSSSPDEAEMKQLNDLKEEYASLQKEASSLEQEKSMLEKQNADKNAKLKKCSDDQKVVRERLGK
jgi:septal ring factor EnvC (AmiA/AmiB activator)